MLPLHKNLPTNVTWANHSCPVLVFHDPHHEPWTCKELQKKWKIHKSSNWVLSLTVLLHKASSLIRLLSCTQMGWIYCCACAHDAPASGKVSYHLHLHAPHRISGSCEISRIPPPRDSFINVLTLAMQGLWFFRYEQGTASPYWHVTDFLELDTHFLDLKTMSWEHHLTTLFPFPPKYSGF